MTGSIWIYTPGRFKSQYHRKGRKVYLGPKCQEALREWLRTELDASFFQPIEAATEQAATKRERRKTKLWPSHVAHQACKKEERPRRRLGSCYSVVSYRRAITRACKAAGVPAFGPHFLRHTAASVIRREFGEETARVTLGHARTDTTALYGAVHEGKAIEAATKIG